MYFLLHKRKIIDHRALEAVSRKFRAGKVRYTTARKLWKEEGTDMLLSLKEYYNLRGQRIRNVEYDDMARSLVAVFKELGWQCILRIEQVDSLRRVVQVFFWHTKLRDLARRFTSNALLIVDATFRTNRKGLPLIAGTGKSNTEKTFPIAFSWCPEEDAESYEFFYQCLREEFYQVAPEPAVVLTDLSTGMYSAYETLKCLPNSQHQHCTWHTVEPAIKKHFQQRGTYTKDQLDSILSRAWTYIYADTVVVLSSARQLLLDDLLPLDQKYIYDNLVPCERRLVKYYTKFFTNLNQYATSRAKGYNTRIHQATDHQKSLHAAAQGICEYVDDTIRDFEADLDKAREEVDQGVFANDHAFFLLQGEITLPVLTLISQQ